ncbi:MAG TPA: Spy/CpxP family protein refolding chaperone [Granulicella sp.]|jgi:Spy/CpxP family protein refolding chaperone|nr:Spy/CpxP family protein refolding chaperone [Granulicella sp.]
MNKKNLLSLTVLLGLLGPVSIASAQQPGPGFNPGPNPPFAGRPGMGPFEAGGMAGGFQGLPHGLWWKNPMLVQQIGVTPEQQKQMDEILQKSRLQLIDLKANVEREEVLLQPMLDANPPNTPQVLAQIDKLAQARADLEKSRARMLLSIRTVLTPEQWTKLRSLENRRGEAFREHMRRDGAIGPHDHRGPDGQDGAAPGNPPTPPPSE